MRIGSSPRKTPRPRKAGLFCLALAWSEVLLTLNRADFGPLLGSMFYRLPILTTGIFLDRERIAGRLRHNLDKALKK